MVDHDFISFEIKNRWTGSIIFTAEIECDESESHSIKLGLAVRAAFKAKADLSRADLNGADLSRADLGGADLGGADLGGADLNGAKNSALAIAKTRILPDGDLVGWKKLQGGVIAKLRIPADAKRSHAFGRKCRAEFADVLELSEGDEAFSRHDYEFSYRIGERVTCDKWETDWQKECAGGIHFFITREEAEDW